MIKIRLFVFDGCPRLASWSGEKVIEDELVLREI